MTARVLPPTLAETVLQQLREDLIRDRYEPGDRVRVDHVAARFGVSAPPVREALRVLLAEGRVQYTPHRGYRVTALTVADVEEVFLMCRLLEAEAVRRGVAAMDDGAVARMASLLASLESPPAAASVWDMAAIHQDFHFVPIRCAGLPRIEAELTRLWDHTDHYRSLYLFGDSGAMRQMNTDHAAFLAAIAGRDAELAVEILDQHREHALSHVAQRTREHAAATHAPTAWPRQAEGARG